MSGVDVELAPGIVANPMICSGAPCIVGRRIMTEVISGRFCAGESPEDIAVDYRLSLESVYDALRYELRLSIPQRYGGLKPKRKRK